MNLKFYKGPTRPTTISTGSVWFNTSAKRIELITGDSTSEIYGGEIDSASYNNNVLKITKIDGSSVTIDLSSLTSITDIENSLASKLNKIKVNNTLLNSTDINLVEGDNISLTTNGANVKINASMGNIDAAKITSGTIDIARLPKGALERLFIFNTEAEALASEDVGEGDTVQIVNNENQMYFCVSDSATTFDTKFHPYTAGSATSVPWSGILGKPDVYTPDAHTHTVSNITDFPTNVSSFTNDAGYITASEVSSNSLILTASRTSGDVTRFYASWDKSEIDTAISNGTSIYLNLSTANKVIRYVFITLDSLNYYIFVAYDNIYEYIIKAAYQTSSDNFQLYWEDHNYVEYGSLKRVATSGSYNDLTDTPTIPEVPSKTSELTNDSGFINSSALSNYVTSDELNEKNALILNTEKFVNWFEPKAVNWDQTKIDEAIENNTPIYVLCNIDHGSAGTQNLRFIYTGKYNNSYSFVCVENRYSYSLYFLEAFYRNSKWSLSIQRPEYVTTGDIETPTKIFTTSDNGSDNASQDVSTNQFFVDIYYRSLDDYVSEHTVGTLHVGSYTQDINIPLLKIDNNEVSNNSLTLGEYLNFDSSSNSLSVDLTNSNYVTQDDLTNSNYVTQDDLTNSNYATKDELPTNTETWTFTMSDGTTYDKTVYLG